MPTPATTTRPRIRFPTIADVQERLGHIPESRILSFPAPGTATVQDLLDGSITGKGGREGTGVIRAQVPRWLNEPRLRPLILAFEYAQPKDGGMGALYILLRRRR